MPIRDISAKPTKDQKNADKRHPLHRHIRRHRKHYARFIFFFALMTLFGVIEDTLAAVLSGAPLVVDTIVVAVTLAIIFTFFAEYTEKLFRKREEKLEDIIERRKFIKKA